MSRRADAGRTTVTAMQTNGADPVGTVRAMFDAYLAQDRGAAERLLAEDLTFTSPQDDHRPGGLPGAVLPDGRPSRLAADRQGRRRRRRGRVRDVPVRAGGRGVPEH